MRTPTNERVSSDIPTARAKHPGEARNSAPERTCVLSGENAPRDSLIRLAISPEGEVLPDPLAKAPGRGAWIGVNRQALEASVANGKLKGALSRSFRNGQISIPDDLPALIEAGLRKAVLDRLGLEKRSGTLVLGNDRLAQTARTGGLAWLAHASDAAEDGCSKLDQAWRVGREKEGSGERGIRLPIDRTALSMALGRENVVHLGLDRKSAAERVMLPLDRLLRFAGVPLVSGASDDSTQRQDCGVTTTN